MQQNNYTSKKNTGDPFFFISSGAGTTTATYPKTSSPSSRPSSSSYSSYYQQHTNYNVEPAHAFTSRRDQPQYYYDQGGHDRDHDEQSVAADSLASFSSTAVFYAPHVNTLARFIMDKDYTNAIHYIQIDPESTNTRIVAHEFMGAYRTSQILPIHLALSQGDVPMELILALVNTYPQSIGKTETGYRRTCLHIALKSFVSDTIISYLIQLYPDACAQQDKLGRLPLHYAISNVHDMSIIREIIHVYPEAVKSWDNLGWTPLHVACQTFSSAELIQMLISLYPEAVLMVTQKGSTPHDIATSAEQNHKEILLPILEEVEQAFENVPLIRNYREAAERQVYKSSYFVPPTCHNID